jgi:hypothetical protein
VAENFEIKVVLKKRVLSGSGHAHSLQRVANVYINGKEYRVSAPPDATGDALDWFAHFNVRQLVDVNSEVEVRDAFGMLALKAVREKLEKQAADADELTGKVEAVQTDQTPVAASPHNLLSILKQSIRYVPANKYAFGVVGIVAAASLSIILAGGKWQVAIAGGVVMLAGMVLLRVFSASGDRPSKNNLSPAAQALTWFCIVAFAVVLSLFIAKLYQSLFAASAKDQSGKALPVRVPVVTPPDRLLSAAPFRAELKDCAPYTCDVDFVLRGYDPTGRLRYDAHTEFKNWVRGQLKDTVFNTTDKIYFRANEKVVFQLYCRLGAGRRMFGDLVSDQVSLGWQEENETAGKYSAWLNCGDGNVTAAVAIAVEAATQRIGEPAVKDDPGPPWRVPVKTRPISSATEDMDDLPLPKRYCQTPKGDRVPLPRTAENSPLDLIAIRTPHSADREFYFDYSVYFQNPTETEITITSLWYSSSIEIPRGDAFMGTTIVPNAAYKITYKLKQSERLPISPPYFIPAHGHGAIRLYLTPDKSRNELEKIEGMAHWFDLKLYDSQSRDIRLTSDDSRDCSDKE